MKAIEIARRLAALGQVEPARQAYSLVIHEGETGDPAAQLEAALYLLEQGGDYKIAYTCFQDLYGRGHFRQETLDIMTQAFYQPNAALQKKRYEKNCKLLSKYPYLFRKDFLPFEDLPIRFYPYDDNGFLPFYTQEARFGPYVNFNYPVVSRNFFADLEKPILAEDVFSQYELEYLNDNVRKSEWVGRENHIYLHYADWGAFCAHLQCWNLRLLLQDRKFVFLIGDEIQQYPLDFKARFGLDYSQYPVRPISIREVNRLIWHTQLSSHNGGDFFNEIFHGHPNLLFAGSSMYDSMLSAVRNLLTAIRQNRDGPRPQLAMATVSLKGKRVFCDSKILENLWNFTDVTEKDILVASSLGMPDALKYMDPASRIVPALFFQPHFANFEYKIALTEDKRLMLLSEQYDAVCGSPLLRGFKYVKTFTPLRRPTTSYGASLKFVIQEIKNNTDTVQILMDDSILQHALNRSFYIDWQERLFKDSVLVRFEDGKLNPRATFTALAAFLDLPYTESLTYCSSADGRDPETMEGNARGFDPVTVYRTYDDYINSDEGYFLECALRDVYQAYGYDYHYYDGRPVDEERIHQLVTNFTTLDSWIEKGMTYSAELIQKLEGLDEPPPLEHNPNLVEERMRNAKLLLGDLSFVNRSGQPLRMMPLLKLDPALLDQPLYH